MHASLSFSFSLGFNFFRDKRIAETAGTKGRMGRKERSFGNGSGDTVAKEGIGIEAVAVQGKSHSRKLDGLRASTRRESLAIKKFQTRAVTCYACCALFLLFLFFSCSYFYLSRVQPFFFVPMGNKRGRECYHNVPTFS